jgi:hypothetical protein
MNKSEYEAEKVRLKAKKQECGAKLHGLQGVAYVHALRKYDAACAELDQLYRINVGPQPSRQDRRRVKLSRKGISLVWE